MQMTRRTFLECAAGAVTVALPFGDRRPRRAAVATVVDLQHDCALKESVAGYQAALAKLGKPWVRADASAVPRSALLILPAALRLSPLVRDAIANCLAAGGTVILESGRAFATPPDFHVQLWAAGAQRVPYVDFSWPTTAKVRDFSRVVPLARQSGEIIARVDGLPVGLKRTVGNGTLIFLGSPLGPALWARDTEAERWLVNLSEQVQRDDRY
jgi:hypothetical protein